MTIHFSQLYDTLLTDFVRLHMQTFLSSRRYKDPKEGSKESSIDYVPEHNQTADPGFIGDTKEFRQLLETVFQTLINRDDLVFDLNGHIPEINGKTVREVLATSRFYSKDHLVQNIEFKVLIDLFQAFLNIRDNNLNPDRYFMFLFGSNTIEFVSSHSCRSCNQYLSMVIDYNLKVIKPFVDVPVCPFVDKIPKNLKIKLKVPSKKLVFLNSPHKFLKIERDDRFKVSINSLLGCIKESEFYAQHNVGFFFVGNCSPSILQKDNEILFTSYNEDDEEHLEQFKDYTYKGYVCTDLWWYTLLDYDLYVKLCSEQGVDPESIEHTVVVINKPSCTVTHNLKAAKEGDHYGLFSKIK